MWAKLEWLLLGSCEEWTIRGYNAANKPYHRWARYINRHFCCPASSRAHVSDKPGLVQGWGSQLVMYGHFVHNEWDQRFLQAHGPMYRPVSARGHRNLFECYSGRQIWWTLEWHFFKLQNANDIHVHWFGKSLSTRFWNRCQKLSVDYRVDSCGQVLKLSFRTIVRCWITLKWLEPLSSNFELWPLSQRSRWTRHFNNTHPVPNTKQIWSVEWLNTPFSLSMHFTTFLEMGSTSLNLCAQQMCATLPFGIWMHPSWHMLGCLQSRPWDQNMIPG